MNQESNHEGSYPIDNLIQVQMFLPDRELHVIIPANVPFPKLRFLTIAPYQEPQFLIILQSHLTAHIHLDLAQPHTYEYRLENTECIFCAPLISQIHDVSNLHVFLNELSRHHSR